MTFYNTPNFCMVVLRPFHAAATTVVLRAAPGVHNSQQRFPNVADVRIGTIYGPGQFEQQDYLTGTMTAGGGSAAYRPIGSAVIRRFNN